MRLVIYSVTEDYGSEEEVNRQASRRFMTETGFITVTVSVPGMGDGQLKCRGLYRVSDGLICTPIYGKPDKDGVNYWRCLPEHEGAKALALHIKSRYDGELVTGDWEGIVDLIGRDAAEEIFGMEYKKTQLGFGSLVN
jgi:hypothetical protein